MLDLHFFCAVWPLSGFSNADCRWACGHLVLKPLQIHLTFSCFSVCPFDCAHQGPGKLRLCRSLTNTPLFLN